MNRLFEKKWVNVVFPHPPYQKFTYEVPLDFQKEICLGHRVIVPLGRRRLTGFIAEFVPQPDIQGLRKIEDILEPYPVLTEELIKLTQWIAVYYMSSWGEVIRTALPPGIHRESKMFIRYLISGEPVSISLTDIHKIILSCVKEKGRVSLVTLKKITGKRNIHFHLSKLEKIGIIQTEHILEKPRVQIKSQKWISLKDRLDSEQFKILQKSAPKQAEVLKILENCGDKLSRAELDCNLSILKSLEKKELIEIEEKEVFRRPYKELEISPPKAIDLTKEQYHVLSKIQSRIKSNSFRVILLHGVTASGKTQVYIEAIRNVLSLGKTALILIPEISLTPQAVQRYKSVFGDDVAVLHSRMSQGERYDSWRKIREGKCRIGLGPRSAVFAPLENLGLIVVDEEHENSYKQMDPAPRYHARDVAIVRAKLNKCIVILGSATPSLETYFNCIKGKYTLYELKHRIDQIPLPKVNLVKIKSNNKYNKNRIISSFLQQKIAERLEKNEQIILLQNRRGYASFLRCSACGNIENCVHCDITLTYHQKDHKLLCHYCGFQKAASDACPSCGGATLAYRGIGTQRVEEEIKRLFPNARLFRMDQDTTRGKNAHAEMVTKFEKRKKEILIGTQMVAKGHDFPGVSLVGVISADTGLYFPDFRAEERTFQLLTQAAGRAGRRDQRGEVVIQTLSCDNPILELAVKQDYISFYRREIMQRKELYYPPMGRIILVRFQGGKKEEVYRAAKTFTKQIPEGHFFEYLGPVFAPLSKIRGMFRVQIIFREDKTIDSTGKKLRDTIRIALNLLYKKYSFSDVSIIIDVDPVDML
jgi:primosomal protein N' (replication factor Y)